MASPNYRHAKRQKELLRKARQQQKQERRAARTATEPKPSGEARPEDPPPVDGARNETLSEHS